MFKIFVHNSKIERSLKSFTQFSIEFSRPVLNFQKHIFDYNTPDRFLNQFWASKSTSSFAYIGIMHAR